MDIGDIVTERRMAVNLSEMDVQLGMPPTIFSAHEEAHDLFVTGFLPVVSQPVVLISDCLLSAWPSDLFRLHGVPQSPLAHWRVLSPSHTDVMCGRLNGLKHVPFQLFTAGLTVI